MKYKITVNNPNYCGVTAGVPFANGVAYVEDEELVKYLVNNFGYKAEEVKPKPTRKKTAKS